MEPGLLRVKDAAKYLNLGRSKTYQMLAAGELPMVRIGRAIRVPTEELKAWVEDGPCRCPWGS